MILLKIENEIAYVTLNRPEKANALNLDMIKKLTKVFTQLSKSQDVHFIFLTGEGKHFCTGADLSWMKASSKKAKQENIKEMKQVADMYRAILACEAPIVSAVKGKVFGAGLGLTAASDIVACESSTTFALPEARLGLVPGVLTPIVARKMGCSRFIQFALTAKEFSSMEALNFNLIHFQSNNKKEVEAFIQNTKESLLKNSKASLRQIKKAYFDNQKISAKEWQAYATASAKARASREAQTHLDQFLSSK